MRQLTLRIDEGLADDLKAAAASREESVNAYASAVLAAAVDPDLAGDEALRLRARLARAGLLTDPGDPRERPADAEMERARAAAGRGRPLAEIVSEERG